MRVVKRRCTDSCHVCGSQCARDGEALVTAAGVVVTGHDVCWCSWWHGLVAILRGLGR